MSRFEKGKSKLESSQMSGLALHHKSAMQQNITETLRFLRSHEFKRALIMTSLMVLSGFTLYYLGFKDLIIGFCIGILLTSFSDLQGSFRHRTLAMLLTIVTNVFILFIMNLAAQQIGSLLVAIAIISFSLANLTVYGNRASSFALSGLLAMVFSLIRTYDLQALWVYLLTFMVGGLLYVLVSTIYHWLTKKSQTIERIGELAGYTSDYLFMRIELAKQNHENKTDTDLLELQTQVTEKQEAVRNLILTSRQFGGQSKTRNRHMLLLIELIDIMELAVANPAKLQVVKENLNQPEKYLDAFYEVSEEIARRLQHFAYVMLDNKRLVGMDVFENLLDIANKSIENYIEEFGLQAARPGAVMLRNLHDYLEKQVENLDSIERLLNNVERQRQVDFSKKQHGRFLTIEDYSLNILKDNFNTKAPIFRHSVRLTIALLLGYTVGTLAKVENAYWILLTIVVIMRPAYGLTRERSNQRVLGTILGVVLAAGLIQISNHPSFFIAIAAFSMLFAFSLIQRNYLLAATAITLNVVFVFTLIDSNHWKVISFRMIDTLIGATVSIIVSYLVYPNWEYVNINSALEEVIKSNRAYLKGIAAYYQNPEDDLDYRLLRKDAFLNTSELNSAFQRFTKDPESKQKNYAAYYEIITLNQSMLSTLANLGSYIQNHHIADINTEFQLIANGINRQLESIIQQLNGQTKKLISTSDKEQEKAEIEIAEHWDELENLRDQQIATGKTKIDKQLRLQLQEVRLIKEELDWLQAITGNLSESVAKI